jgi:hypothetical protein
VPLIHRHCTATKRKKTSPGLGSKRVKVALELTKHGKLSAFGQVDSEIESNLECTSSLFGKVPGLSQPSVMFPEKFDQSPFKKSGYNCGNSNNHLACASIDWLCQSTTIADIGKYVCHDDEISK